MPDDEDVLDWECCPPEPPPHRARAIRVRFTRVEREAVLRSVIGSEALAGFTVPREVAERALDELENQPPPAVDFPEQLSAHQRIAAHRILFRPAPPEAVSLPEWPDNEEARNG